MKSILKITRYFLQPQLKMSCCFLVLCFFTTIGFSQETALKNVNELEVLISKNSEELKGPITDSLQLYSNLHRALKLAQKENNKTYLGSAQRQLSTWHSGNVSIDSSEYYLKKATTTYQNTSLHNLEAETHLQLEDLYKQRGDYTKAMAADFKALAIYENEDNLNGIAISYTRLCDLLYYQEKYAEGIDYCQKAIDIQQTLNAPEDLSISHRYKADNLLILERYDEALVEINNSINVLKEAGFQDIDIAPNYNTRGNIYKYLERYDEALVEYKKVYRLAKEHNQVRGLIPALGNIGHVYRLQERYDEALPYTLDAIDIMKSTSNPQNLWENYLHASRSYDALKDYENALKYERLYSEERFKNLEQINKQLESELQIKYETAKKDETIVEQDATINRQRKIQLLYIGIAVLLAIILFGMYFAIKTNNKKRKALVKLNEDLATNQLALEDSNTKLKKSLTDLKATQAQLIQSEKMASLGELTAGIAHEIQNPLNFVNNFAEVSSELIDDMLEELENGNNEEVKAISQDLKDNLKKINNHGKRADDIVKGMLQHSRNNSGEKQYTDLNKLTDEFLRLAYHGLRAKDKNFNAHLETQFDPNLGKIKIVSQDIGRVILNLFTNAFYAVNEKLSFSKVLNDEYKPTVTATTMRTDDTIMIIVKDNGNGIPNKILDKIYQPFFTTKPSGKGTGLGLSMSYDIIKAHNGTLEVTTQKGAYTEFKITLPIKTKRI
ncbi:ATP-binding protein [Psychroserpens sp. Hel_I_66]|uniref:tetratricopeptide repeat-containing sensor histidine kinase n=1 Tax=Psychroserpens sp. Hel_I_66 TaxID=1250004 RepID=UPI00068F5905|nr:ATP-binding protein [Psychroserpens sp. Hel_I_66]